MKKKVSLILNIIIVILEIIGLIVTYNVNNRISIEYYTEDSNILSLISSLIFVIFLLRNKEIPEWLKLFKYTTTICLTVTFLVVMFILAPMYNFNYAYMLFHNSLLYQHFLCPILAIITFILFDNAGNLNTKDNLIGINLTVVYAIVLIALNIFDKIIGPYPFLMVKSQPVYASIIWFIVILGLAYTVALILRKLYIKFNK